MTGLLGLRHWTRLVPLLSLVALLGALGRTLPVIVAVVVAALLAGSVLAAVHHAEVVAHRVGEPFGSLILAVAVTVIEVSLIVTLMISGGDKAATLAKDTVFSAVMITVNGIAGITLYVASRRGGLGVFNAEGSGGALAAVATLATLCLVLPTFTIGQPGPEFTGAQLAFAAVASLFLYFGFVLTQTVRHRDFFLPVDENGDLLDDEDEHAEPPSNRAAWQSLGFLMLALVAVVGLAKVESPSLEKGVVALGMPLSFVGVIIAMLVLAPETVAARNAARRGRTQTGLNLAYGSAMASIGLTIPTLAIASIWLPTPLKLGLGPVELVLLVITFVVGVLTVVPGRATRLQAAVHLVLLAAYIFLAASP